VLTVKDYWAFLAVLNVEASDTDGALGKKTPLPLYYRMKESYCLRGFCFTFKFALCEFNICL
jgi:hypothetical protein